MKAIPGNQRYLKELNQSRILNLLREEGHLSRIELSHRTQLDAKTITNVVNTLLEKRLIRSGGFGASRGGRPREMLELNPGYGYSIGIDLGASQLSGILTDFQVSILSRGRLGIGYNRDKDNIIEKIKGLIVRLIKDSGIKKEKILGIGFVVPGIIDQEKRVCRYAVNIKGWRDVPVCRILEEQFSLPTSLEESSRAMAWAERCFGRGRKKDNFIFLDLGIGIGCGIISQGRLHYGATLSAGEIGHTIVELKGRRCRCGNRGCLETVASGAAIPQIVNSALKKGKKSIIGAMVKGRLSKITARTVAEAAKGGDELAIDTLKKAGQYLGVAVANLINILNPSTIIVGGGLAEAGESLLGPMKESIKRYAVRPSAEVVEIFLSGLGEDAGSLGAVTLVLNKILKGRT